MTPTLMGRIQTRIFAVVTAGLVWTVLITPILAAATGGDLGDTYKVTLTALFLVGALGVVVWEPLYHGLQQFRWEKDWPAMFILLEAVPEGILLHAVLIRIVDVSVDSAAFIVHFATTWMAIFVFIHGPMRVPFLRWRFRGGRII